MALPITIFAALSPRWTAGRLLISLSHRSTPGVPPSALPALFLTVGMAKFSHVNAPTSAMEYSSARKAASPSLRSSTWTNLTASRTKRWTAEADPSAAETKCKSWPKVGPTPLMAQKSQDIACSRRPPDAGNIMPLFSARYTRIAPELENCPWAAHAVVVDNRRYLSIGRDCEKLRRVLLA